MFKRCAVCRRGWQSVTAFCDDAELLLMGVEGPPLPQRLRAVFVHNCGHTFSVAVLELAESGRLVDDAPKGPAWRASAALRGSAARVLDEALFLAVQEPAGPSGEPLMLVH